MITYVRIILFALPLVVAVPASAAQPARWNQITTSLSPSARQGHRMVFDSARQRVVLFGGWSQAGWQNDTWEYDGATWRERFPSARPPARWIHALAYDELRQRVVLFSGAAAAQMNDTWEWDGTNWTQMSPTNSPPPQQGAAMAFHRASGRIVMVGGHATWEWDGTDWTLRSPSASPSGRDNHSLTLHEPSGHLVLFGGWTGGPRFADTWTWNGTDWIRHSPALSPSARIHHASAADSDRGALVLFGGDTDTGPTDDTWEWDGVAWSRITTAGSPPSRSNHSMAYDTARKRVVMFGGTNQGSLGDTWEYHVLPAAEYTLVGPGCPGSSTGVPQLSGVPPVVGQLFRIDLTGSPSIAPGALFFSATAASFDLGPIGAPGCTAFANPHVTVGFVTDFNGVWFSPPSFTVPNLAELVGASFWNQGFVADLRANALGLIASPGWRATIGY